MYIIQMYMQCSEKFLEILPNDLEHAELMLEDLVSHILLDLFVAVIIDEVSIRLFAGSSEEQQLCSIQIEARCVSKSFPLSPNELEKMELALEDRVSCALVELLGTVNVEKVTIGFLPSEEEKTIAFSSSA